MSRLTATVDPAGHLILPESLREEAGIVPGTAFEVIVGERHIRLEPVDRQVAGASEDKPRGAVQIEAEIDRTYDQLRDLVARSSSDDGIQVEIKRKREQLHALKVEEAAVLRRRAESMRRLEPGEVDRLLRHAEELLAQ